MYEDHRLASSLAPAFRDSQVNLVPSRAAVSSGSAAESARSFVPAVLLQQLGDGSNFGVRQWGPAIVILGVDIGAVSQKHFDSSQIPLGGQLEHPLPLEIFWIIRRRIV